MSGLNDPAAARALQGLIDRRIASVIEGSVPRTQWAIVAEVFDLYLTAHMGDANGPTSEGILWGGVRPAVGDRILVQLPPPGGTRRVVMVMREAFEGTGSGGGSMTLEDLLALGLVDTSMLATDLAAHEAEPPHLRWNTPNTGTADDGKWSKLAEGSLTERYAEVESSVRLLGGGSSTGQMIDGHVTFRIRQEAAFGSQPVVVLRLWNDADIVAADVGIVITSVAGPTLWALYVRVTRENEWATYIPDSPGGGPNTVDAVSTLTWLDCQPFITNAAFVALGTVTTATAL